MSDILGGSERICPICRKVFWARDEYVYKRKKSNLVYTMCSYSCMRKFDAGWETHGRGKRIGQEMSKVLQMHEDGLSIPEMARILGCTPNAIKYHLKKMGLPQERKGKDEANST